MVSWVGRGSSAAEGEGVTIQYAAPPPNPQGSRCRCLGRARSASTRFWRDPGYAIGALAAGVIADILGLASAIASIAAVLNRVISGGRLLDDELLIGSARSTMDELASITLAADKVVVF
jgi:hypothetical protein